MDDNLQKKITLACIALLQKNAADEQQARKCGGLYSPKTKKEAIAMFRASAHCAQSDIAQGDMSGSPG